MKIIPPPPSFKTNLLARFLTLVGCPYPLFWSFISTEDILGVSVSRQSWTGILCDEHRAVACYSFLLAAAGKEGPCLPGPALALLQGLCLKWAISVLFHFS